MDEEIRSYILAYANKPFEIMEEGRDDVRQFLSNVSFEVLVSFFIASVTSSVEGDIEASLKALKKVVASSTFEKAMEDSEDILRQFDNLLQFCATTNQNFDALSLPSHTKEAISRTMLVFLERLPLLQQASPELVPDEHLSALLSFLLSLLPLPLSFATPSMAILLLAAKEAGQKHGEGEEEGGRRRGDVLGRFFGLFAPLVQRLLTQFSTAEETPANETVLLRFMDCAVQVCTVSDAHFLQAEREGLVGALDPLLASEDPLVLLNMLELMNHFLGCARGREHLLEHQLANLLEFVEGEEMDPIVGVPTLDILTALLIHEHRDHEALHESAEGRKMEEEDQEEEEEEKKEVEASIFHSEGTEADGRSSLLVAYFDTVAKFIDSTDPYQQEPLRLSSYSALSAFCTSSLASLELVLGKPDLLSLWLRLNPGKAEMNAGLLHSLALVLDHSFSENPQSAEDQEGREERLKRALFGRLGAINDARSTMELLVPFITRAARVAELKQATYHLLRALVNQPSSWGMHLLFSTPSLDFLTFLCDRETEFDKEGKEWKFDVILAIHESEHKGMLTAEAVNSIESLVEQGPYYKPARHEVETMS